MEKSESGFSRPFLIIVGSIVLVVFAGYMWGFQTVVWWEYKGFSKKTPILKLTPQDLPNVAPNQAEGMKLSHAGFEFEVPWTDLDPQKSKFVKNIAIYGFDSGRVLEFFGPGPDKEGLLSAAEKSMGDTGGRLQALFGEEATKSDYAFRRTLLDQTSDELKPWMNQRKAVRVSMLLMIKGIASVGGETGLFKVEQHGWKGFQFDDPNKQPKRVTLELNDDKDQHLEIIFIPGKKADAAITQSDVNRVLQTLAPTSADGAAAAKSHSSSTSAEQKKPQA